MNWNQLYSKEHAPTLEDIQNYIDNPLWEDLCKFIETSYSVMPSIEHSICSMAPGWNVKYKKSSKSLCTLYPAKGTFTCMVVIGSKEVMETELILPTFDSYIQDLYHNAKPFNGARWLCIEVTSPKIVNDVKEMIQIRVKPKHN